MEKRVGIWWCAFADIIEETSSKSRRAAAEAGKEAPRLPQPWTYGWFNIKDDSSYFFMEDEILCEQIFCATNLQEGFMWSFYIEPNALNENRSHTSLSVGDIVTIGDKGYECMGAGWRSLTEQELAVKVHRLDMANERASTAWVG